MDKFNPLIHTFGDWVEQLESSFVANGVTDDNKKAAILITSLSSDAYSVLKSLTQPSKPSEKAFKELVKLLNVHFSPKINVISERFKFYTRNQLPSESVSEYVVELKKMASNCIFDTFYDDALRDRLVSGVSDSVIQSTLLQKTDLNFTKAFDIATTVELADNQLKLFHRDNHNVNKFQNVFTETHRSRARSRSKSKSPARVSFYTTRTRSRSKSRCNRCGRFNKHKYDNCPAKNWRCFLCGIQGHTSRVCQSTKSNNNSSSRHNSYTKLNHVRQSSPSRDNGEEKEHMEKYFDHMALKHLQNIGSMGIEQPLYLNVIIGGHQVKMEVDTGASFSVFPKDIYGFLFSGRRLVPCGVYLQMVTGDSVKVMGKIEVQVKCGTSDAMLDMLIINTSRPFIPLIGRNWLDIITPNWRKFFLNFSRLPSYSHPSRSNRSWINHHENDLDVFKNVSLSNLLSQSRQIIPMSNSASSQPNQSNTSKSSSIVLQNDQSRSKSGEKVNAFVDILKSKFHNIFEIDGTSCIKDFLADIQVKENCTPIFCKYYEVPFAIKDKVHKEINRLVVNGIISPVMFSKWASPIVCVPKKNGEVRICCDFRVSVNKVLKTDQYPLPKMENIFAKMAGSNIFCALDLSGAYQQVKVSEKSKQFLTINTEWGLFQFNRLPFGIASAPAIFQHIMDCILKNLPGVSCYLDDVLIGAPNFDSCAKMLEKVCSCLSDYNVKINPDKCVYFRTSVSYLGHVLSEKGISPNPEKIKAIQAAPEPQNLTQLKSYLGLLSFYSRFIPNMSSELKILYDLTKKGNEFFWTDECSKIFTKSKILVTSNQVLTFYDPSKPIILTCDASPYGVGAVLSHRIGNSEMPVFFASSTLSSAEQKYAQIQREALAIVFAVKRFHKYLYGQKFTLVTDHQPLREICNPSKGLPVIACHRLQRWPIILSAYQYDIVYRKGSQIGNADALSRLPLNE